MSVLEIGGNVRPALKCNPVREYVGLDIDQSIREVESYHRTLVQSVEDPIPGQFDLVFSKYVLEHVRDNEKSFQNMSNCTKQGGVLLMLVPCGLHPYSILTRIVGNDLQRKLIALLRPHAAERTGFPAYYDQCTPNKLFKLLAKNGFEIDKSNVAWGAAKYFDFFLPFFIAVTLFNQVCRVSKLELFASGVVIAARKTSAGQC